MTQTVTERLGQGAVDALHQAIQIAWQAGYDQAVSDMNKIKTWAADVHFALPLSQILRWMIENEYYTFSPSCLIHVCRRWANGPFACLYARKERR